MRGDALRTAVDFAELPSTTDSRDSEAPYSPRPARSDPAAVLRTDEVASPIKGWSPCVSDVPRRKTVLQHKRPRVGTVRPAAKGGKQRRQRIWFRDPWPVFCRVGGIARRPRIMPATAVREPFVSLSTL